MEITSTEYIRWVKGSLNLLLSSRLPDEGSNTAEYRAWVVQLQTNQKLPANAKVDEATQNSIIKLKRFNGDYIQWVRKGLKTTRVAPDLPLAEFWDDQLTKAVKKFQMEREQEPSLKADGWVGAKTETALIKYWGRLPPGRIPVRRPPPPPPKPSPHWDPLSPDLRLNVWANAWHIEVTRDPSLLPNQVERRRVSCMLSKFASFDKNEYLYLTFDNVRAHIYGTDWRSYNRGVTADDIANDARKELLNQIKYFQRMSSQDKAYERFQSFVLDLERAISRGLSQIHSMASDDIDSKNPAVKALRRWVVERQESAAPHYSILRCFA